MICATCTAPATVRKLCADCAEYWNEFYNDHAARLEFMEGLSREDAEEEGYRRMQAAIHGARS